MKKSITFFFALFYFALANAQCAMCKASAETSIGAGATQAAGINSGVLYILFFVFLFISLMGYILYKTNRNAKFLD